MKKMIMFFLSISLWFFSCEKSEIEVSALNADSFVGEWRYVRTSTTFSSFFCLENCPNFDYNKSKYILNLEKDGKLTGKINLLIINGKYTFNKITQTSDNQMTADEAILEFNILNKPPETPEDSEVKTLLENTKSITFQTLDNKTPYHYLTIYTKGSDFMLFVKKI